MIYPDIKNESVITNNRYKDWTILIYANGNNDLEPEMWHAVSNVTKVQSNPDINVVIQIGRADEKIVKLLRKNNLPQTDDNWNGVRRYFFADNKLHLVDNLGKINMADSRQLYEFIKWGIQACPAKRYMLILGGHGYQFVGTMTDYTQEAPYIMGIPEMTEAINKAANEAGKKIDILMLDTCYFNFIEAIYELGKNENHAVQNVITYIFKGPIQGLPYNEVIELLQSNSCNSDTLAVIRQLVNRFPYDLVAFSINHQILKHIKCQINELALNNGDGGTDLSAILHSQVKLTSDINTNILQLVIHFKRVSESRDGIVAIANMPTSDLERISRYYRLDFAQNNFWTYLLSNKGFDVKTVIEQKSCLLPLELKPTEVYAFISIMNPELQEEQKKEILKELYIQRNWK